MSSPSKKHKKFLAKLMEDKKVTELPGIGVGLGTSLAAKGFQEARYVLDKYLALGMDKEQFQKWMKDACDANKQQSHMCYECLSDYCKKFPGEVAGDKKKGGTTNAKSLTSARSEWQGRNEGASRLYGRRNESGEEEAGTEEEEEGIEEERTFQRNGQVQMSLGTSEEERARAQELGMGWREWKEEARQKMQNDEIQARRAYRLNLELSEKIIVMEEKMKRMEDKYDRLEKRIAEMGKSKG